MRALDFLAAFTALACAAGGEPPLPAVPDTRFVEELSRLSGTEQLAAILEAQGRIEAAIHEWKRLAERAEPQQTAWELAMALFRHAEGELDVAQEIGTDMEAIKEQRTLLDDTDHLSPCVARLADALRAEVAERHRTLGRAVEREVERLIGDATWLKLDEPAREAILGKVGLVPPPPLAVETNEALRESLDDRSLEAWASKIDAVPTQAGKALEEAARRLPADELPASSVTVRRGTLTSPAEVRSWLAEHETKLTEAIREGPVIVR